MNNKKDFQIDNDTPIYIFKCFALRGDITRIGLMHSTLMNQGQSTQFIAASATFNRGNSSLHQHELEVLANSQEMAKALIEEQARREKLTITNLRFYD